MPISSHFVIFTAPKTAQKAVYSTLKYCTIQNRQSSANALTVGVCGRHCRPLLPQGAPLGAPCFLLLFFRPGGSPQIPSAVGAILTKRSQFALFHDGSSCCLIPSLISPYRGHTWLKILLVGGAVRGLCACPRRITLMGS